ncbi:hypothetical protein DBR42_25125 [Pelomonas sp. HMWF004]|nr:hypothetical protein DBR42_25125 [Pelomonas sp. HMWF004]
MNTVCPKCRHVRPHDATAPAWQCPACGVAYAKASAPVPSSTAAAPLGSGAGYSAAVTRSSLPLKMILTVLAVVVGIWWGHQARLDKLSGGSADSTVGGLDDASIRQLASSVRADHVVMYSTTECGNCAQAKSWLTSYGFAYTECNMTVDSRCVDEFQALSATGTPYLVVRGPRGEHHMKEGFDSDEFLAALKG